MLNKLSSKDQTRIELKRKKIDLLNIKLTHLFIQRLQLARDIAEIKRRAQIPLVDKKRTKQMLVRTLKNIEKNSRRPAKNLLHFIFSETLKHLD